MQFMARTVKSTSHRIQQKCSILNPSQISSFIYLYLRNPPKKRKKLNSVNELVMKCFLVSQSICWEKGPNVYAITMWRAILLEPDC